MGLTRLRNARIPSTISVCVNLDSFSSTGTSNATGAPYLVIVIFSLRATRLRRSEKRALASTALTVVITPSLTEQVYNFSQSFHSALIGVWRRAHNLMRSSSTATLGCAIFATFKLTCIIDDRKTRTAKSGCATGCSRQRRKLDAAPNGVDAFGADADAVAEFPDVPGVRASPAGLFLFPRLVCRRPRTVSAPGNNRMVLLAIENVFAGELRDAVDGDHALDKDFRQFDEESEFLHGNNQSVVLFAEMLLHELRGFPGHQFALGGFDAALSLGSF